MKNRHITTLKEVVPIEIRLEVYKKALIELQQTESNKYELKGNKGLCILLPCILWNLNNFRSKSPLNNYWCWSDTPIAFPELTLAVLKLISNFYTINKNPYNINNYRSAFIEKWIKDLTNQIKLSNE